MDEDPCHIIYEAEARELLKKVSKELWELRYFQNACVARIDKTCNNLEDRFVSDYVSYRTGQNEDPFIESFLKHCE